MTIDALVLLLTGIAVLAVAYLPGFFVIRMAGVRGYLALGLAPAASAGIAALSALVAGAIGVPWSLLPYFAATAVAALAAWGLWKLGWSAPGTRLEEHGRLVQGVRGGRWWIAAAFGVALGPIIVAAGRADAILERWDTLYHLSALQRIRETGNASSLVIGSVSNSAGEPSPYPGGFHALASLIPAVPIPILLNASVLVLTTVPWALGCAVLARAVWPSVRWAPLLTAVVATIAPAVPLNLWIHLSPIPNVVGFAMLPGVIAAAAVLWRRILAGLYLPGYTVEEPGEQNVRTTVRGIGAAVLVMALAGIGLGLVHPNVAVMALILIAVLTTVTSVRWWRRRPWLAVPPVLALLPVAVLSYTPLASMVTGYTGGLVVPWWQALGELALGLLTVWPMALGVVLALLWWPGLVRAWSTPGRWLTVAWVVVGVMYLDAALDSPLDISTLFYRGQDRIALALTMITSVLAVPGMQAWLRAVRERGATVSRVLTIGLTVLAVAAVATSVPARSGYAAMNLDPAHPTRGRFLQPQERELFEQSVPQMDQDGTVLASPYSGASHLYAMYGQDVRFPVGGMAYTDLDRALLYATEDAADDPAACALLRDNGIRYVYQERRPYAFHRTSDSVNRADEDLGNVLFETDHSRMIEVDCGPGGGA